LILGLQVGIHWTPETPRAVFVNIDGFGAKAAEQGVGKSRMNTTSAALARRIVDAVLEAGVVSSGGDIGERGDERRSE
jgi:hypothetical protein